MSTEEQPEVSPEALQEQPQPKAPERDAWRPVAPNFDPPPFHVKPEQPKAEAKAEDKASES